tara:strand:- start:183842 stop:185005 length:1164 start_codon:yes stop_codon:yes gene_type:complete
MKSLKITLSAIAISSVSTIAVAAADFNNQVFKQGIDQIFSGIPEKEAPGCSVGVIEKGVIIHRAGYGIANLEHDIPLDDNTIFRMASISKQFTAMSVHLMAEDGIIDLDEDIRTYLPDLIDYGQKVTIRAMLGHYSGMGDYDLIAASYEGEKIEGGISLKSAAGGPFRLGNEDYVTIKEFYELVKKVKLKHVPGTTYEYSNLAYFLFSMLVEERTGLTLRQYAQDRIFTPLQMKNTLFVDDGNEIIKMRATGYAKTDDGRYQTDMTNLFMVGDGGLHTSINDFIKWDQNFYTPKLGKDPTKLMNYFTTPPSDWKFEEPPYANGQNVEEIDGRKAFTHSGGWLGTSTFYMRFPDEQFSVVTLCNDVDQTPSEHSRAIAKLFFELRDKK